jgi:hypothetical protein
MGIPNDERQGQEGVGPLTTPSVSLGSRTVVKNGAEG